MLGRVLSVEIVRPGQAALIAKNGWPCAHPGCNATPTVEVEFTRQANGPAGYSVGSHGTCDEHAEAHARALRGDVPSADVDPCPKGDPGCETGDDGSCHDACEAPAHG